MAASPVSPPDVGWPGSLDGLLTCGRLLRRLAVRDGRGGSVPSVATQFSLHVADPSANSGHALCWVSVQTSLKTVDKKKDDHQVCLVVDGRPICPVNPLDDGRGVGIRLVDGP